MINHSEKCIEYDEHSLKLEPKKKKNQNHQRMVISIKKKWKIGQKIR